MQKLLYLGANANIPFGRTSSTARKGLKWWGKVSVGDTVEIVETESGKRLGYAAIVAKEVLSYTDVIANADHNHVGVGRSLAQAKQALAEALAAAYGENKSYENFTVLHILPLKGVAEAILDIATKANTILEEAREVVVEAVKDTVVATQAWQEERATNRTLLGIIEGLQDDTAKRVAAISEDVVGIITGASIAEEATGVPPTAVERANSMGDITVTTRVEFDTV
jgi:hypothetical protein